MRSFLERGEAIFQKKWQSFFISFLQGNIDFLYLHFLSLLKDYFSSHKKMSPTILVLFRGNSERFFVTPIHLFWFGAFSDRKFDLILIHFRNEVWRYSFDIALPCVSVFLPVPVILLPATHQKNQGCENGQVVDQKVNATGSASWK